MDYLGRWRGVNDFVWIYSINLISFAPGSYSVPHMFPERFAILFKSPNMIENAPIEQVSPETTLSYEFTG